MKCPADVLLVEGQNVKCKEDSLTGEPDELPKTPLTNENYQDATDAICFAKSEISNGEGFGIVMAVGTVTAAGGIMLKVQEEGEEAEPTML
jgi:magnesium-transporting ATPase (P-type)